MIQKSKAIKSSKLKLHHAYLTEDTDTNIFINDSLTKLQRKLLNDTKLFKNEKKYKYVWVKNGRILLKKDDESRTITIKSRGDLDDVKAKFNIGKKNNVK